MIGRHRKILIVVILSALLNLPASSVFAHAFGVRYDLPIPLGLFLIGAGAAVLLSFVVMARFLRSTEEGDRAWHIDLLNIPGMAWLGATITLNLAKLFSVTIFGLLLFAGLFGNADPLRNIAPTFVWIIWWVGMAFISALVGNLWTLINPWDSLFVWLERTIGGLGPIYNYPTWLARWPAVGLFIIFAWLELIFEQSEQPRILATLIVAYSAVTWSGMALFGREVWLRNGEVFTLIFGLLSRFAVTVGEAGHWYLRPPALGLLSRNPLDFSTVCFVLLLLTTVTFDGILETPLWAIVLDRVAESEALREPLIALQNAGVDLIAMLKTIALVVLPCILLIVYLVFSHAIAMFGSAGRVPTSDVVGYFILSLIPIAIAYHLSHYYSFLLVGGQYIIPLASDPFGYGWNLFGSTAYRIDIGIVNAKTVWYLAVSGIVIGHVYAVYIGHHMAIWVFEDHKAAIRSQFPMLVLMILYTMLSLWILSQPIIS